MGNLRFEEEENSIGTNRQERWWGIRPDGSEMEKGRKRYLKKKKKKKASTLSRFRDLFTFHVTLWGFCAVEDLL